MKNKFILILLLVALQAQAQDTLNLMFYNLYRFPVAPPEKREMILADIFKVYRPDLFMVCELVSEAGADRILDSALQTSRGDFARAPFWYNHSESTDTLQQMVFYNRAKLELTAQTYLQTQVRDINRYSFRLRNNLADTVRFEVFVAHLKAGTGSVNRRLRAGMADTFKKALAGLPAGSAVLLAGDFNLYGTEPAYLTLTDTTGPVRMTDPLNKPGAWSDNPAFAAIHTQATRLSAAGFGIGGATGGLDDRFDFILMSESFRSSPRLYYVDGSYKAFGNNGNCFNQRIDDTACTGPYSFALRRNLHNMSDHTPVVMQLAYPALPLGAAAPAPVPAARLLSGNIVSSQLVLQTDFESREPLVLRIFNTPGQMVKCPPALPGSPALSVIEVGDLPAGLYYLRLSSGPRSRVFKFIKR
ncbi:hypothetical protein [Taibaiella chishuiensis]|uniref:Secreted protein (Por secretion system target) n=1 Tax=Taibaiella chishuiensis TaxID=1434707 RepID=A0A2P8DAN8_9BACT|nr:hypothetical protein [Taibaiella chishuiensis]PSK94283.1 hypothetical protein B0I18_101438 [Taibaiella chishuiensis]